MLLVVERYLHNQYTYMCTRANKATLTLTLTLLRNIPGHQPQLYKDMWLSPFIHHVVVLCTHTGI